MKSVGILILTLAMFTCSTKNDPAPVVAPVVGGCTFTFKGQNFSSTTAVCKPGELSADPPDPWALFVFTGTNGIQLEIANGPYLSTSAGLTANGNTISFNTTISTFGGGDSGVINGKCTCTSGAF